MTLGSLAMVSAIPMPVASSTSIPVINLDFMQGNSVNVNANDETASFCKLQYPSAGTMSNMKKVFEGNFEKVKLTMVVGEMKSPISCTFFTWDSHRRPVVAIFTKEGEEQSLAGSGTYRTVKCAPVEANS